MKVIFGLGIWMDSFWISFPPWQGGHGASFEDRKGSGRACGIKLKIIHRCRRCSPRGDCFDGSRFYCRGVVGGSRCQGCS